MMNQARDLKASSLCKERRCESLSYEVFESHKIKHKIQSYRKKLNTSKFEVCWSCS